MKKVVSMLIAFVMVFSLVACGGGSNEVGKYSFQSMDAFGQTLDAESLKSLAALGGEDFDLDSMFSLELKSDGTFTLISNGDEQTGEYGNGKMTIDGEAVPYTFKDGVLTIEEETTGMKLVFKKK